MKAVDINFSPREVEIDPLQPNKKTVYKWHCNRCGRVHKALHKPRIFDMTPEGLVPAECIK